MDTNTRCVLQMGLGKKRDLLIHETDFRHGWIQVLEPCPRGPMLALFSKQVLLSFLFKFQGNPQGVHPYWLSLGQVLTLEPIPAA